MKTEEDFTEKFFPYCYVMALFDKTELLYVLRASGFHNAVYSSLSAVGFEPALYFAHVFIHC